MVRACGPGSPKNSAALERDPTNPLRVHGDQSDKTYVIFRDQALPTLWDEYIRNAVARRLAAIDRGKVEE